MLYLFFVLFLIFLILSFLFFYWFFTYGGYSLFRMCVYLLCVDPYFSSLFLVSYQRFLPYT